MSRPIVSVCQYAVTYCVTACVNIRLRRGRGGHGAAGGGGVWTVHCRREGLVRVGSCGWFRLVIGDGSPSTLYVVGLGAGSLGRLRSVEMGQSVH